jgi:hypothetical protein
MSCASCRCGWFGILVTCFQPDVGCTVVESGFCKARCFEQGLQGKVRLRTAAACAQLWRK